MLVTRLQTCPQCHADVSALTPPGRCPECGLEFDEHTRIWRSSRSWQHYAIIYGLAGLGAGLFVTAGYGLRYGEVPNALLPVATALTVAAVGLVMHRVLTGRMSGRFVATTRSGILVGTRRRSLLIPWEDVRRITTHGRVPKIQRRDTSIDVPLEDVFAGPEEVAAFQKAVADARSREGGAKGDRL